MPFTVSHVAAVVPLLRLTRGRVALVPSALVIGSMVPDLPYFVPVPLGRTSTHAASGLVTVDLLLGLVTLVAWHGLLAPAAVALAPAGLRARLAPGTPAPARRLLGSGRGVALVLVSLLVGSLTHVALDAFTHPGGWGVTHVEWLATEHGRFDGYRWAQYVGGLGGLAVLAGWAALWWRRSTPADPDRTAVPATIAAAGRATRLAAALVVALPGLLVGGRAALPGLRSDTGPHLGQAAFWAVTRGGAAALAAAVGVAAVLVLLRPLVRPSRDGAGRAAGAG
jgi:hypothetical protein